MLSTLWAISSGGECLLDTQEVTSSKLVSPTTFIIYQKNTCICLQLWYYMHSRGRGSVGRAQPCQGWGRGFEPRRPLHFLRATWPSGKAEACKAFISGSNPDVASIFLKLLFRSITKCFSDFYHCIGV